MIEVNPRGSRTVPFLSKVTGVPMVQRRRQHHARQVTARAGIRGRPLAEAAARRREGARVLDVEANRRRHLPRPGDEIHRRGDGHRRRLPVGAREGAHVGDLALKPRRRRAPQRRRPPQDADAARHPRAPRRQASASTRPRARPA